MYRRLNFLSLITLFIVVDVVREFSLPHFVKDSIMDCQSELKLELNSQSIDYETCNSTDYKLAVRPFHKNTKIFSYCIGYPCGKVDVHRLDSKNAEENLFYWEKLKDFWADTSIHKISHNSKFEYTLTRQAGIDIPDNTILHDTMIQSQMLRNLNLQHGLAWLCYELNDSEIYEYNRKTFNSKELDSFVAKEGKRLCGYNKINKELFNIYQVADGQRCFLLHNIFFPEIYNSKELLMDYYNELELIKVTYQMEKEGLCVDIEKCEELLNWLNKELIRLPLEVQDELGYFVNLGSDKQVSQIIFTQLGLPVLEFTEKGVPSTDKNTILKLIELYPDLKILKLVLKHRSYTKGKANIQSYINFCDDNGIIHPNIRTNGAHKTGRQSSDNPNLQNIEKETSLKNLFPVPARYCFIVHDNCVTISVDYDAIELRLILEAAQSTKMMENLRNGISPHVIFCKVMFGSRFVSKQDSKELYDSGKNGHFCLCYGGSLKELSDTLQLSREETINGKYNYKKDYPEIVNLISNGIDKIKNVGYIKTAFGRQLWIEPDKLYSWLNYYIQGTAAGILKRAQVKVHKYLIDNWNNSGIQIILCVHDELLIKYPRNMLKYKEEILKEISLLMTNIPEIKSPLQVAFKYTRTSWAENKPLKIG